MSTAFTLLMILIIIACLLLVIIVMAQNPKGGGLSSTFGGASSSQFGVQRTNDFMEKATWTLGGIIIFMCLVSVVITAKPSQVNYPKKDKLPTQTTQPAPAPANNADQAPEISKEPITPAKEAK